METELKMTLKEADRLAVMKQVESKKISLKKASEELGLGYRQTRRAWKRYQKEGSFGLISKRRNKPSNNQLGQGIKDKALKLLKEKYPDYGPTFASEKLKEKHSLILSKETIRQMMIKELLWKAKKVKERKVYARRTRRSRFGELEQIDGSPEYWFEDRGEKCCLLVCVDDATSSLMTLRFCKVETTQDYLDFLKIYLERYGRPLAFYSDKHSVFRINNKQQTIGSCSTRFQDVLKTLDIKLICAHSPQAKGRVERANGVLQDRLIKEMRERGISTIEEANKFADEEFRLSYNKKFSVSPADKENAHRKLLESQKAEHLFMEKEERILSKDLSFRYKAELYQITSNNRHSLYGKKVEIYERSGEIVMVLQNGKALNYRKWQEKLCEPTQVMNPKELELLWPTVKRKINKKHPWR